MAKDGKRNHLPLFGVGPLYVLIDAVLTVLGVGLSKRGLLPDCRVEAAAPFLRVIGFILIAGGFVMWLASVLGSKIDDNIMANKLVTTGVYACVRNPIYSAFVFACTGVILVHGNLLLLVLPPAFWAIMTVMMRNTEEKWLLNAYGDEYAAYCRRVNRCIPWFPRR